MLIIPANSAGKSVNIPIPWFIPPGPGAIQRVMASPPTIAQSTVNPLPNQRWSPYDNSNSPEGVGCIDLSFCTITKCGNPSVSSNNQCVQFQNVSSSGAAGVYAGSNSAQVSVIYTSPAATPVLVLAVLGRGEDITVRVHDANGPVFATLAPLNVPVNGVLNYISVTFAAPVVNLRIDFLTGNVTNNFLFSGFFTLTGDSLYPAPKRGNLRLIFQGDSYATGTGAGTALGMVQSVSDYLGIDDVWGVGVGGTGLIAVGPGSTYIQRMQTDVYPFNPDVVVIQGFFNDNASNYTAFSAAVLAILQNALAALPNAIIVIFGPCVNGGSGAWGGTKSTFGFNAQRAAISAAMQQLSSFPNLKWIDPSSGPAPIVAHQTTLTNSPAANATTFTTAGFMCEGTTYEFPDGSRAFSISRAGFTATVDRVVNAQAATSRITQVGNCFIRGSGNVGAPTGIGNADTNISADGIHPAPPGHLGYAMILGDGLTRIFNGG